MSLQGIIDYSKIKEFLKTNGYRVCVENRDKIIIK